MSDTKNLIEQLKKPEKAQPLGLLSGEKQEVFRKARIENCLDFRGMTWEKPSHNFHYANTYILNPDYKPESEYVDLEIQLHEGFYGAWSPSKDDESIVLPFRFTHLHCLLSLPGFDHFERDTGQILLSEHVANAIYSDGKVFARFRGES